MVKIEDITTKEKILLVGDSGTGKCIAEGSYVVLNDSLAKIENVDVGSNVYSYNGNSFVVEKVTNRVCFKNVDTIKVTTDCGYSIEGTPEHKIVAFDGNMFRWIKLSDIKDGVIVPIVSMKVGGEYKEVEWTPSKIRYPFIEETFSCPYCGCDEYYKLQMRKSGRQKRCKKCKKYYIGRAKTIKFIVDENVSRFFGYVASEGYVKFQCARVYVGSFDVVKFIEKVCDKYFGYKVTYKYLKRDNCYVVVFDALWEMLLSLGVYHNNVPQIIFESPLIVRNSFLKAYFDGDGGISRTCIEVTSVRKKFLEDIQLLLLFSGIFSVLREKKDYVINYGKCAYRLIIIDYCLETFIHDIGMFISNSTQNVVSDILGTKRQSYRMVVPNSRELVSRIWTPRFKLPLKLHRNLKNVVNGYINLTYNTLVDFLNHVPDSRKEMPEYKLLKFIAGNNILFDKVVSVSKSQNNVYDISVKKTHNYIANGYISHNTYNAVYLAINLAKEGRRVYFTEPEDGSSKELVKKEYVKLGQKVYDNIDLNDKRLNFKDFYKAIYKIPDKYDVVIVDGLHELFMMNIHYFESKFIEQGYYVIGDTKFDIEDEEIFNLPYVCYPKVYNNLIKALYKLLEGNYNFVITMIDLGDSPTKKRAMERIKAKFDTVIELFRTTEVTEKGEHPRWYGIVRKNRGRETVTSNVKVMNVAESLLKRLLK